MNLYGRPTGWPCTCANDWRVGVFLWCRIASPTCTCGAANQWTWLCRPAGWSRRSSQYCGSVTELWIAHGSGDADLETVDEHDRLRVPPEDPRYSLRRVWLNKEEEEGYYYGFANEGLWPLCHIAHTRPIFRAEDWKYYQAVNVKFADALLEEMKDVEKPIVLVQDYHFALLPRLIKERRPEARVAIFWHIPWPAPQAFDISPWRRELVDGLLGADLIGFHIQSHCNNFLQTVDRVLEARVDWEHFSVATSRSSYPGATLPHQCGLHRC